MPSSGLKKAWLSKLRNGQLFPSDWGDIHRIVRAINLSDAEYSVLMNAFKAERLSPEMQIIDSAVHQIYSNRFDKFPVYKAQKSKKPTVGALLQGDQLIGAVCAMLASAGQIRLSGVPQESAFQEWLYGALISVVPPDTPIQWLMYLEQADVSAFNVRIFADAMPLLLRGRAEVRQICKPFVADTGKVPFQVMLIADSELLLLNETGTQGIYLNGDAARAHQAFFERAYSEADNRIAVFRDPLMFLRSLETVMGQAKGSDTNELHLLLRNPWIVNDASETEIHSNLQSSGETADFISSRYYQFLGMVIEAQAVVYNYFTESGLKELLRADEYHEFSETMVKNVPKELRNALFSKTVAFAAESNSLDLGLLYDPFPDQCPLRAFNLWSNGTMIYIYDSKPWPIIVFLKEPGTVHAMIAWLKALRRCGMISTKETALRTSQQELTESIQKEDA